MKETELIIRVIRAIRVRFKYRYSALFFLFVQFVQFVFV